ncbi:MAG: hypothetical protein E6I62_00845 [Chloroflexi bacterium]|nr:MAG: hypothetical protein E6I62_00845 [Chloroflexota bacterium]
MADLNEGRIDLPRSRARLIAFAVTAAVLFAALGGRLFQMQVLNGSLYADRAVAARTIEVPIKAPRGLIFDRTGRPVAVNVPSWTVDAVPADLPAVPAARDAVLARVASSTSSKAAALKQRLEAFRGSPYDQVPLLRGITRDQALLLSEQAGALPGIVVQVDPVRQYLDEAGKVDGSLLAHVLGYTGPVSQDQVNALAARGYLPDDSIGKDGVEASYEAVLRGTYGAQQVERDASGRPIKVISTTTQAVPGRNLMLTIDARLQRLATDALTWGMRAAGVKQGVTIVMNPQTGEILAMVSLPSYDDNQFATGISTAAFNAYLRNPNHPLRNHAIADIYPPGSTFKLVTGTAALMEGVTTPTQLWPTYGCYQIPGAPTGQCLFDWNHAGFGPLNIEQAFFRSSDTFFYQMAIHLGIDRLAKWAYNYGFGKQTGIKLPGEASGIIASTEWAQSQGRANVFTGELAQAGIGQNVIAVTPLQLANAYAALANDAGPPLRGARGGHQRARIQYPRRAAPRCAVRQDRNRGVRDQAIGRQPAVPLLVRGLPAVAAGRDRRQPRGADLLVFRDGPRQRLHRGGEVLPAEILQGAARLSARSAHPEPPGRELTDGRRYYDIC